MSDDIKIVEELKSLRKKVEDLHPLIKKVESLEKDVTKLKEENKLLKKATIQNETRTNEVRRFINTLRHTLLAMNEKITALQRTGTTLTEGLNHIRSFLRRG